MDSLDDDFRHSEELGFTTKFKSILNSIRIWTEVSSILLIIAGSIGFLIFLFSFYEALRLSQGFRFEDLLFISISIFLGSAFIFFLGVFLKKFSSKVKKGFKNQDQFEIENGFKNIKVVVVALSILLFIAFIFLVFILSMILLWSIF